MYQLTNFSQIGQYMAELLMIHIFPAHVSGGGGKFPDNSQSCVVRTIPVEDIGQSLKLSLFQISDILLRFRVWGEVVGYTKWICSKLSMLIPVC